MLIGCSPDTPHLILTSRELAVVLLSRIRCGLWSNVEVTEAIDLHVERRETSDLHVDRWDFHVDVWSVRLCSVWRRN